MPKDASPAQAVLAELGYVLFAREEADRLRLLGKTPAWLAQLWPALGRENGLLPIADASPFLENFLIDAEECWQSGDTARALSGPWVEEDATGAEQQLEATALTIDGQPILLLERLGAAFEAKKNVLQRARETVIAHQRLNSEIQKKEILLHCVAEEMTAALANTITSLRLIELEDNGPRTKLLLALATRATEEQQRLIHRVLSVFEGELRAGLTKAETDVAEVVSRVLENARPLFAEKGVTLEGPEISSDALTLPLPAVQLEGVLNNLLENARERTARGGHVALTLADEAEAMVWQVEDNGTALAPDSCANLFRQWDPTTDATPAAGLRLHFCRIVAENCGGEIGCEPLPAGGNRFWIRLTKSETR